MPALGKPGVLMSDFMWFDMDHLTEDLLSLKTVYCTEEIGLDALREHYSQATIMLTPKMRVSIAPENRIKN